MLFLNIIKEAKDTKGSFMVPREVLNTIFTLNAQGEIIWGVITKKGDSKVFLNKFWIQSTKLYLVKLVDK